jgi:hypothetical protein
MNGKGERFKRTGGIERSGITLRRIALVAALLAFALSRNQAAYAQIGYVNKSPPYAQNDSAMTMEGFPTVIGVLNNDYGMSAPLDPSSIQIVNQPLDGVVSVDPSTGNVGYLPDPDFVGTDDFTYVVFNLNGQVSNIATVTVYVMEDVQPPEIQNFAAVPSGNGYWTFSGQVMDDNPGGITVTLGGIVNATTTTRNDGTFSYTTAIAAGTSGEVTAQAMNDDGILSPVVDDFVFTN